MFKICDSRGCQEWAQWKIVLPDDTRFFFCTVHRHEFVKAMEAEDLKKAKVYFCGVVPIQHVGS